MPIKFTYWQNDNQPEFEDIANGEPLSATDATVIAMLKQIEISADVLSTLKQIEDDIASIKVDVAEFKAKQS